MNTRHLRRISSVAVAAALVALSVGSVSAANTRQISIGSPNAAAGSLVFTPAKVGGKTAVDIVVSNTGGQTVNHAALLGGTAADTAAVNPLFPPPAGNSLPAGLTYAAAYPLTNGVSCTQTASSLNCDLGSFTAGASKSVRVVIQTSSAYDTSMLPWFGAYLAESNSTGTNQDNFYATGALNFGVGACEDADYFLSNTAVSLTAGGCSSTVSSGKLSTKNGLGGAGTYASLAITSDVTCLAGYTCFGDQVTASVLGGAPVTGGVQWNITWTGTNAIKGVIHFWDTYNAGDPAHAKDYDIIPFTKQFQCSKSKTTNCWNSTTASKNNAVPLTFNAVFTTPSNGRGGGFI